MAFITFHVSYVTRVVVKLCEIIEILCMLYTLAWSLLVRLSDVHPIYILLLIIHRIAHGEEMKGSSNECGLHHMNGRVCPA